MNNDGNSSISTRLKVVTYCLFIAWAILGVQTSLLVADTPPQLDRIVETFKVESDDGPRLDLSYQGLDLYAAVPNKSTIDQDDRDSLSEMKRLVLYNVFQSNQDKVLLTAIGSTGAWLMDTAKIKNDYAAQDEVNLARLKQQGFYMEGMSDLDFVIMGSQSRSCQRRLYRTLGQGRGDVHITQGELTQLEIAFIVDEQVMQLTSQSDSRRLWRQLLNVRASAPHPEKYITVGGKALYMVEHLGERGVVLVPGESLRIERFKQWAAQYGHEIGPFTAQFLYGGCCDMDYFMRHAVGKNQEPVKTVMQVIKYLERQAWMLEQAHAHAQDLPDGLTLLSDRISHLKEQATQIRAFTQAAMDTSAWSALETFEQQALALSGQTCMAAHALSLEMGRELLWRMDRGQASDAQVLMLDDIAYDIEIVHNTRYHDQRPDWYEIHEHTVKQESIAFIAECKTRESKMRRVLVEAGRLDPRDKELDTIELGPIVPPPVVSLTIDKVSLAPETPQAGDGLKARVTLSLDGALQEVPDWSQYRLPESERALLEEIAIWSWRAARTRMEISSLMKQDAQNRQISDAGQYVYTSPYELAQLLREDLPLCEEAIKEASEKLGMEAPKSQMGHFQPKLAPATIGSVDIYFKHLTETMQQSKVVMEAIRAQTSAGLTVLRQSQGNATGQLSQSSQRLQQIHTETLKKLDQYNNYLGQAQKLRGYVESIQKIRGGDLNEMSAKAKELWGYLDRLACEAEISATDAVRLQHRITNEIHFLHQVRNSIPAGQQPGLTQGLNRIMQEWDGNRKGMILDTVPEIQERAQWLKRGSYFAAGAAAALKAADLMTKTFNAYDTLSTTDLSRQSENAIAGLVAIGGIIDAGVEYLPMPVLRQTIKDYASLFVEAPKWASAFDSLQTMRYQGQGYDVRAVLTPKAYTGLMEANPDLSSGQFYKYNGPLARYNRLIIFGHPTPDRQANQRVAEARKENRDLLVNPETHRLWLIWDKSKDNGFLRLGPETFARASLYAAWFRRVFQKQITGPQLHDLLIKKEVYVGGTFLGETVTVEQLQSRAASIRRVDSLKYYLAEITSKSEFERDEMRRYYGMLDRAARRMARQGFMMHVYDVQTLMEKVNPDPPISGNWEKAMEAVPLQMGTVLGAVINKGDEIWDSLSSGEQTRLDQGVSELIQEKTQKRIDARQKAWTDTQTQLPAGLTLKDIRLVVQDQFRWKDHEEKQDHLKSPSESQVRHDAKGTLSETAEDNGTYTCRVMVQGYEDSQVFATVPFQIKANPRVETPTPAEPESEGSAVSVVSIGPLSVQCPPEPQPEPVTNDLKFVQKSHGYENLPEEYYWDRKQEYKRVYWKTWWDQNKTQLKSHFVYGLGRDIMREAYVVKYWDRDGNRTKLYTGQRDENGKQTSHGLVQEWYPGGQIKEEKIYINDDCVARKGWNKNGVLTNEYIYTDTAAWEKSYYDDGRPKEEESQIYDEETDTYQRHGIQKQWYDNGQLKTEQGYAAGQQHGVGKNFRKDGTPSSESYYKEGARDGVTIRYDNEGRKRESTTYRAGQRHGLTQTWDEKGQLTKEAYYEDNQLHGVSKSYRNGKLYLEIGYANNQKHGDYKEYEPDGSLKKHQVYQNGRRVK